MARKQPNKKRQSASKPSPSGEAATPVMQPWSAPGINTQLRGRALVNVIERTLARLEAERQLIHAQDRELLKRAVLLSDKHKDAASRLRSEILDGGIGDQPTLEDAYGHHLTERSSSDSLTGHLDERVRNFKSRTDPQARTSLNVPPHMNEPQDETEGEAQ